MDSDTKNGNLVSGVMKAVEKVEQLLEGPQPHDPEFPKPIQSLAVEVDSEQ